MTIAEINQEIAELKTGRLTRPNVSDLAMLYYVRQNMQNENQPMTKSAVAPKITVNNENSEFTGDSEFSEIISGKNINDVLAVMEELMETLRVANSSTGRLYNATLRKLKDI